MQIVEHVTLIDDVALTGTGTGGGDAIDVFGGIDGPFNLTINDTSTLGTIFQAPGVGITTPLASLTVASGSTALTATTVQTTGDQIYNAPVALANVSNFTSTAGGNLTFGSTVDALTAGFGTFTTSTTAATTFSGDVGGSIPLNSLDVTAGQLAVSSAVTVQNNIQFTVPDSSSTGDDATIAGSATIESIAGGVTFDVGDNIDLQSGAAINAAGAVQIFADADPIDPDTVGAVVNVAATIAAASGTTVTGGQNADEFTIVPQTGTTFDLTGNDPPTSPGDSLNVDAGGADALFDVSSGTVMVSGQQDILTAGIEDINLSNVGALTIAGAAGTDNVTVAGDGAVAGQDLITVNGQTFAVNGATALVFNGSAGDDIFTFDATAALPTIPVTFNGGDQDGSTGGDQMVILGTFTTQTLNYEAAGIDGNNGSVIADTATITYTGLEPIDAGNAADTVLNLNTGVPNTATLQDNVAAGSIEIVGGTFEDTVIPNPTNSLTVNLDDQGDALLVNALDNAYAASLIINGGLGADDVQLNAVTINSTPGRGLDVADVELLGITGSTISNNTADTGGGLRVIGGTTTIDNTMFTGNTATGNASTEGGGAIHVDGVMVIQNSTVIDGNTAVGTAGSGGGILVGANGTLTVNDSTISNNTANRAGGGIETQSNSTLTINGSAIIGNRAGSTIQTTFDNDLEGWTTDNLGAFQQTATGGNPGGFLFLDNDEVTTSHIFAPNDYLGDISQYDGGTFSFDGNLIADGGTFFDDPTDYGRIRITGVAGMVEFDVAPAGATPPTGAWQTFTASLDAATFGVNQATWIAILSDVTEIRLSLEALFGDEQNGIDNVRLAQATPSAGNGGGLHVTGNADVNVVGASITGNTASGEGGGLWNDQGIMTINGATAIANNVASGDLDPAGTPADLQGGGGVFNNGGTLAINDSGGMVTISNNRANGLTRGSGGGVMSIGGDVTIIAADIASNSAVRAGGGIEIIEGTVQVVNSSISLNEVSASGPLGANPGNGGGLHVTGAANVTIDGGSVTNNIAEAEGGGLWNSATGTLTVTGQNAAVNITDNIARGDAAPGATLTDVQGGGGIFNNGGTLNLTGNAQNVRIDQNAATGSTNGSGGGILSVGGNVNINASLITTNEAVRAGGGIEVVEGTVTIIDSFLTNNDVSAGDLLGLGLGASPGNGGGLHVTGAANVTLDEVEVSANVAALEGGGLWNNTGTMTLQNGTEVMNNTASGDAADDGGGGIFNNGGSLVINDATTIITNNVANGAAGNGGGIHSTSDGSVTITNASVTGNTSASDGAGLFATGNAGTVGLTNVTFNGNISGDSGGGALIDGPTTTIDGSTFTNNTAQGNLGADGNGGGLFLGGDAATGTFNITNTMINSNNALGGGGGLFILNVDGTITGGTFNLNQVTGTGVAFDSGSGGLAIVGEARNNTVGVDGATIDGNMAPSAAGIGVVNAIVSIANATISNNTATEATSGGGGIGAIADAVLPADLLTITGTTIDGNTTAGEGGGIGVLNGTFSITDSTISNNNADGGRGGGIGMRNTGQGGFGTFVRTTISANTATGDGGGIAALGIGLDAENVTVSGNDSGGSGGGLAYDNNVATGNRVSFTTFSSNTSAALGANLSGTGNTIDVQGTIFDNGSVAAGGVLNSLGFNLDSGNTAGLLDATDLVNTDALLLPLADNGGPVLSHATANGSPARDIAAAGPAVDTRGVARPADGNNDAVLLFDAGSFESEPGQTIVVDNLTDIDDGDLSAGNLSIREAIVFANTTPGVEMIIFDATVFATPQTITLTGNRLDVNDSVIITGPAARLTISGNNLSQIFHVTGAANDVTISDMTLTQGSAPGMVGGALEIVDGRLTLNDLNITASSADVGGAVANLGGKLVVNRSTITGNSADFHGGGIGNISGTTTITDSTIDSNTAVYYGGGIRNDSASVLTIARSTIAGNSAGFNGGGIESGDGSTLEITNSTISGNTTDDRGGGISVGTTPAAETDVATILNTTITGNNAATAGGGIAVFVSADLNVRLNNTIVAGNEGPGLADDFLLTAATLDLANSVSNVIGDPATAGGFTDGVDGNIVGSGGGLLPIATLLNTVLSDNGGPTQTHALVAGSVAIDAADVNFSPLIDQRGVTRPIDGDNNGSILPDVGAFEFEPPIELIVDDVTVDEGIGNAIVTVTLPAATTSAFTVQITTSDGTAIAPGDYTASTQLLSFNGNAGETQTFVVPIIDDTVASQRQDFFIQDTANNAVSSYNITTGEFLGSFVESGAGGLTTPHNPTFGPDGNLYVASNGTNQILRYDGLTGDFIDIFVDANEGGFTGTSEQLFGPDGNLYLANAQGVFRFDPQGDFIDIIAGPADGVQQACGIEFGSDGNLYVYDTSDEEMRRFDPVTGNLIDIFIPSGNTANACDFDFGPDGDIFITDLTFNDIRRFSGVDGSFLGTFATTQPGVSGITFGPDGNFYVNVSGNTHRFDGETGAFIDVFVPGMGGFGNFSPVPEDGITETINVSLANPSIGSVGVTDTAVITINDNDFPTLTVGNLVVDEAAGNANVTVTLDVDLAGGVTVDFATSDGTATAGSDYTGSTGTLTFVGNAGETQIITVPITDDLVVENNETVAITFGTPSNNAVTINGQSQLAVNVPGIANPWLAGLPDGTTAAGGDSAPGQSPVEVLGLDFSGANTALTFSATGLSSNTGNLVNGHGPDGDVNGTSLGFIAHNQENGFSTSINPINALIGVFLTDDQPNLTPPPAPIDFNGNLDFASFSPVIKQPFFIGDGLTSGGVRQQFVIPNGATRLFLGTHDAFGYFNNVGSLDVVISGVGTLAGPAELTINDNDTATVSVSSTTVNEDDGFASVTVSVDNAVQGGFNVDFTTVDGTALSTTDYTTTNGTLNLGNTPNSSLTFTVPITNDLNPEPDEQFTIQLSNVVPQGNDPVPVASIDATAIGTVTIVDSQQPDIVGQVFCDADGDGDHDDGEEQVGIDVFLDLNGNGAFDQGEPVTLTNAMGNYQFANVVDPTAQVTIQIPPSCNAFSSAPGIIRSDIPVGLLARGIASGDIDGLPGPELFVVSELDGKLTILNNVGGTFELGPEFILGDRVTDVAALSTGGQVTVAAAGIGTVADGGAVHELTGQQITAATIPQRHPGADGPSSVIVDFLNDDNVPDIASGSFRNPTLNVRFGGSNEEVTITTGAQQILSLASGNLSGSIDQSEVVVTGFGYGANTTLQVYGFNGTNTPNLLSSTITSESTVDVEVENIIATQNDDRDEVAQLLSSGQIIVRPMVGGALGAPIVTNITPGATAFAFGQFNQDQFLDVAVANLGAQAIELYAGNGQGGFVLVTTIENVAAPSDLVVDDFNLDGFDDVAAANFYQDSNINDPNTPPNFSLPSGVTILLLDIATHEVSLTSNVVPVSQDFSLPQVILDTNGDALVTAADALRVINVLDRALVEGEPSGTRAETDVNGDGRTSAVDALMIINHLDDVHSPAEGISVPIEDLLSEDEDDELLVAVDEALTQLTGVS